MERVFIIAAKQEACVDVLELGLTIAKALGMKAEVFDYLHEQFSGDEKYNPRLAGIAKHDMLAAAKARHTQALAELGAGSTPLTVEWGTHLAEHAISRANPADYHLMIKAVHPVDRFMPTDWHLIRNTRIPLLLMTEKPLKNSNITLVSLNLDDPSGDDKNFSLVAQGHKLAKATATELHLVFVKRVSMVLRDLDLSSHQAQLDAAHEKYDQRLESFGIAKEALHLMVGDPKLCLVDLACKLKSAYLVVGTEQRKGLMGLMIGNTAEAILEHIHSNVLVVPSKGEPLPI
ncbi:universal stress protein [Shewanella sp.]